MHTKLKVMGFMFHNCLHLQQPQTKAPLTELHSLLPCFFPHKIVTAES